MLEEAIMEAKAGGAGLAPPRESFSPQITVDAPIMIPEEYVPDLDLRRGLYRRMNVLEDRGAIEYFAVELFDCFGKDMDPGVMGKGLLVRVVLGGWLNITK